MCSRHIFRMPAGTTLSRPEDLCEVICKPSCDRGASDSAGKFPLSYLSDGYGSRFSYLRVASMRSGLPSGASVWAQLKLIFIDWSR